MPVKTRRALSLTYALIGYVGYTLNGNQSKAQSWLFSRFYNMGGVYIKFLQLLALHENRLNTEFNGLADALAVFDNANYEPINIQDLLQFELGPKSTRIKLKSPQPFAAGSFAQVYEATLDDNKSVVVKVLRPSVAQTLNFDLSILKCAARVINLVAPNKMADFVKIVSDFAQVTLDETNYIKEVTNANELKNVLGTNPTIIIPNTFTELSTRHIIIQEKIEGLALTHLLAYQVADKLAFVHQTYNTDLNYVMERLATELIGGSLSHKGTYGDPHPGNIYILTNNRIALIDFGISISEQKNKAGFIKLLQQYSALYNHEFLPSNFAQAMLYYFMPELTNSLQTLSTYLGKQDLAEEILMNIGQAVDKTVSSQANDDTVSGLVKQYRMMYLLTNVVNKNNRFGLQLNIEQPEFLRSAHIFLNLIHLLGCDKKLLGRAFKNIYETNRHLATVQQPSYDSESIDRSFHYVANWFEHLQQNDPKLYSNLMHSWSNS